MLKILFARHTNQVIAKDRLKILDELKGIAKICTWCEKHGHGCRRCKCFCHDEIGGIEKAIALLTPAPIPQKDQEKFIDKNIL